jgi:hypothetical protein
MEPASSHNNIRQVAASSSPSLTEEAVEMLNQTAATTSLIPLTIDADAVAVINTPEVVVIPIVVGETKPKHFHFDNERDEEEDDDDDDEQIEGITFVDYRDESQLDSVMALVGQDLSEPYSSTSTITK